MAQSSIFKIVLYAMALVGVAVQTGCYYDSEQYLYGIEECDLTVEVTYTDFIQPLMESNCNVCHSSAIAESGVVTDTYTGVQEIAESGLLFGAINHASGFTPMPKNAEKLSDCEISKVKLWIDSGFQNN